MNNSPLYHTSDRMSKVAVCGTFVVGKFRGVIRTAREKCVSFVQRRNSDFPPKLIPVEIRKLAAQLCRKTCPAHTNSGMSALASLATELLRRGDSALRRCA